MTSSFFFYYLGKKCVCFAHVCVSEELLLGSSCRRWTRGRDKETSNCRPLFPELLFFFSLSFFLTKYHVRSSSFSPSSTIVEHLKRRIIMHPLRQSREKRRGEYLRNEHKSSFASPLPKNTTAHFIFFHIWLGTVHTHTHTPSAVVKGVCGEGSYTVEYPSGGNG